MLVKYFAFVIPRILAVKRNRTLFDFWKSVKPFRRYCVL